ncbi:MAG: LPS export ABC transporter periplasmic protein LptC [Bacteroidales bacterium]|nr:LPS export ABC transporter periplasmic protein LptC [Candidatus Cryptobacteroides fimicaballi]
MATASAVAFVVISCKGKLGRAEDINLDNVALRSVEKMFAVETKTGKVSMRIEADLMEGYETDTTTYETFPKGLQIYSYLEDGRLQTIIFSNNARHITSKSGTRPEVWQAFGNVKIRNVIKQEMMETDTLYWDQGKHEIWTDCYVKMTSPSGLMQGYGMRSDDRAENAILHKPFDGYTLMAEDTVTVIIDSVNFIGPFVGK